MKAPQSTKASDLLHRRAFIPNIDDSINEDLKDISGIVGDISNNNIEESSFTIDIFKDKSISQARNMTDTNNNTYMSSSNVITSSPELNQSSLLRR